MVQSWTGRIFTNIHEGNGDIVHRMGNKREPPKIDGFKQFWHTGLRVNVCGSCGEFKKNKLKIKA